MLEQVKAEWQLFRSAPAGERFLQHHERYQRREAPVLKSMLFFASVFCAGMSVLLPMTSELTWLAFGFAAVAAVLLPGESRSIAKVFDKLEVLVSRRAARTSSAPKLEVQQPPPPEQSAVRAKPARPTVRMPLPTQKGPLPAVLTAPPIIVADKPRVRRRATPPVIAGTLKIWTPDAPPQPSAATNVTIVMFPPPARDRES